uniref:Ion transport domain-containing protein n=1 Tax=Populus trichocarpa TaxID=3694 RepID=A0A2K1WRD4_POPTR
MEQEINKWSRPANPRPFLASRPTTKFRRFRRHHQHAISLTDPNPLQILWRNHILDPDRDVVTYWKHVFLITLIVALFIDPLYFFLPYVATENFAVLITYFRFTADLFFFLHILMKFRTVFVAPSSRVFGR